jgi:hypothetical protein
VKLFNHSNQPEMPTTSRSLQAAWKIVSISQK